MDHFKRLAFVLEEELENQKKLLTRVKSEREGIIKVDPEKLEATTEAKTKLIATVKKLEKKRRALMNEIALQANYPAETTPKLSELLAHCSSVPQRRRLDELRQTLRKTAENVKRINLENLELIKYSLRLTVSTASIVCGTPEDNAPTYGESGKLYNPRTKNALGRSRAHV